MSDRTIATDALATLGTIIDDTAKRDAIHLAVVPAIAGANLKPGMHVEIKDGVAYKADVYKGVGIVDPFLRNQINKGERFWLILYPRTITSLRHVWSHPDFLDEETTQTDSEVPAAILTIRKQESEKWLRRFCDSSNCPSYDTVMELIDKGHLEGTASGYYDVGGTYEHDYLHFNGTDASGEIPPEFWIHAEIVLGRKLPYHPTYFSCSC